MRKHVYRLLRRTLSQTARNRLKQRVAHARRQLAPLYRMRYGTFTADQLVSEIASRAPTDFEILMVHCSLNDLQPAYTGSLQELLDALSNWCGPERTLAMPAFFFGGADLDPAAYYSEHRCFDARRTPSQMGLLSELFRRRAGVRRSLHPTHAVCALGPLAGELVASHHEAGTTFGEGTPFAVMAAHRTAIIGVGTEYFRCLTQVHVVEDILGERFPLALRSHTIPVQIKNADGDLHDYQLPVIAPGIVKRVQGLELLLGPEELVQWRFHGVPLFVTSAERVTDVLLDAALRGETVYEPMPIRAPRPEAGRARPRLSARAR